MELSQKRNLAERFIKLGMDVYSSLIASDCTASEIEALQADETFTRKCDFWQKQEVANCLELVDKAMAINIPRGISVEARWKLSKIDKGRFGDGISGVGAGDKKKFTITFETAGDSNDDNMEVFSGGEAESTT
jgi:hypothetical protein